MCLLPPMLLLLIAGTARGEPPDGISAEAPPDGGELIRLPLPAPDVPASDDAFQAGDQGDAETVDTPEPDDQTDSGDEPLNSQLDLERHPDPWIEVWQEWWETWEGSVELGLNGTEGNSETLNYRLGAKVKYETPAIINTLELTHVDKSSNGEKTALNTLLDGRLETPFPDSPWTYFIHGLGEFDHFKEFDVRASVDTGLGYEFIQRKANHLIVRLGGSASREFGGVTNRYVPELTAGLDWKLKITDRQKLSAKVEYFPDVTDWGEYRLNSRASWEISVAPDWGLSLKLSAIDRYDGTPGTAKNNDLDYSLLLLWNF